jgi:hypothetical protein
MSKNHSEKLGSDASEGPIPAETCLWRFVRLIAQKYLDDSQRRHSDLPGQRTNSAAPIERVVESIPKN